MIVWHHPRYPSIIYRMLRAITFLFPIITWLPEYSRRNLFADTSAGLTVAVLLIPQAMAYALIAGVPPVMGLYAAMAPLFIYALMGSSRQLSVGPVALDSLLIASSISLIAVSGTAEYITLAIALALLVGALQIAFGLLRLGYVVNFLARPVISGFTSAAAIIISLNQLDNLFGIDIASSQKVHELIHSLGENWSDIHPLTAFIGILSFVLLVSIKQWRNQFPSALFVLIIATIAVWYFELDQRGVAIVGTIPAGLPSLSLPTLDWPSMSQLVYAAITIAFVGYMEGIAVAKRFATQYSYAINDNRELASLGAANLTSGFFGGFAIGGSFSRTAVNAEAGARTQVSSIVAASCVAITLLAFTGLFYFTPKACLAAIILAAILRLIDITELVRLAKLKLKDMLLLVCAFLATLFLGVLNGILFSVIASLIMILSRITRPPITFFGRVEGSGAFRNFKRERDAKPIPGIILMRIEASLYFNNAAYFKDKIYEAVARHQGPLKALIIDAGSINEIDTTAQMALEDIAANLKQAGIQLCFVSMKGRLMDMLEKTRLYDLVGKEHFYFKKSKAVQAWQLEKPIPEIWQI